MILFIFISLLVISYLIHWFFIKDHEYEHECNKNMVYELCINYKNGDIVYKQFKESYLAFKYYKNHNLIIKFVTIKYIPLQECNKVNEYDY